MRWLDIEKSETNYQASLVEKEKDRSQQQAMQQKEKEDLELQKRAKALGFLGTIHTQEVLEAIRDDVWKEGTIEETFATGSSKTFFYGLQLRSEPYDLFKVRFPKDKKILLLETLFNATSLRVLVDIEQKPNPYVYVSFGPFRSNIYDFNQVDERGVEHLAQQRGLRDAVITKTRLPEFYTDKFTIEPDNDKLTQPLHHALYTLVSQQKEANSLPYQIREWGQNVLQQLPEQLRREGVMHKKEICEWERQSMGIRKYYIHRIIGFFDY